MVIEKKYYDIAQRELEEMQREINAEKAQMSEEEIPIRLTNQVLYQLQEMDLIHEVVTDAKSEEIGYQPSMDINQLNVAILLDRLDTYGSENFKIDKDEEFSDEWKVLTESKEEYYKKASKVLLKDL